MSVTASVAHVLPLAPALVAMAAATASAGVIRLMRGLPAEIRALSGEMAVAQASPMIVRVSVRATGAAATPLRLPDAFTADRCLPSSAGRAAA